MKDQHEKACPNCHKEPLVKCDEHGTWIIECHSHIAKGQSLADAIKHWNIYITFIEKGA